MTTRTDPLITFVAARLPSGAPASEVAAAVSNLNVAELPQECVAAARAWLARSPDERRCHVVACTGRSWHSGTCAATFARDLVPSHGGAAAAWSALALTDHSTRNPADRQWWVLVEAELSRRIRGHLDAKAEFRRALVIEMGVN